MAHEVTAWLAALKLPQYGEVFLSHGYDAPEALHMLEESDLDVMGITLPGATKKRKEEKEEEEGEEEEEIKQDAPKKEHWWHGWH